MRIATITFQQNAVSQMQDLQAAISKTQTQLATSSRLQSAADDPAAMVQVNRLNVELAASKQYVTNGNSASTNLKLEEQGLSDATNTLQSARDLAVQANNPTLTAVQRQDIATQLKQLLQDLVSIGNQRDSTGNYLFAGTASATTPFVQSGNSISYAGAASVNQIQIAANQRISAGDTGAAAFMNIPAGNGTFTTANAAANTGNGSISTGTVTNAASWVPDTYTISFISPTQYQITNSAGTVVPSGSPPVSPATFQDGDTISFNGVQVEITGTPAATDTFTVAKAGTSSAFNTLSSLITTLSSATLTPAQLATQIGGALQQIDGAITNMSNVSASVGARLNSITSTQSSAQTSQVSLQTSISDLSATDYAAAVTALNTQELALKAAQQSYASIAQLSLFNYIK
jgi:flagellar hook-associated protein 3 FlgL